MKEYHDIWNTVVSVTNGIDDIARSMRIPIYMSLIQEKGFNFRGCLKGIKDIGQLMRPRQQPIIQNANKNRFLFCFPYPSPSNMNNITPVAIEAKKRELISGIVLGRDVSRGMIDLFKGIPVVTFMDFMSFSNYRTNFTLLKEAKNHFDILLNEFRKITPGGYIKLKINAVNLLRELYISIKIAQSAQQLFEIWSPAMIISTSDFWPFEHQLCHQGHLRGIPSSIIQHGVISEFWWPFVASTHLLWGNSYRKKMLEIGADPARLKVCGMPGTDVLFNKYTSYEVHPKQNNRLTCLILSQAEPKSVSHNVINRFKILFKDVINLSPHVDWKVKLHPRESSKFYDEINNTLGKKIYIYPKSTTLENAVIDSDVVLNLYSTAGLEAMIMKRPLIILDISPEIRNIAWWPSYGGGVYCNNAEDVVEIINNIKYDCEYRENILAQQNKFINDCFANRGKATEFIIELLEKSLN